MKRTCLCLCLMAMYGCVSTPSPNTKTQNPVTNGVLTQEATEAPVIVQDNINGVTAKSLEGKKYQVFLGAAYLGVRDQLKDGEMLTLKDVELKPSPYDRGYFRAHFLDTSGAQLFTEYYALADVGLLDSRLMEIDTSVTEEKVNQGRGEVLHGKTPEQAGVDSTYLYMSTSNGDKVRAFAVSLNKGTSKDNQLSSGLSFSCSKGKMYGVASISEPFIALNEGANLKFSFPGKVNITVRGEAIDSESVFFSIPQKLENQLVKAEAGELWVHPDANGPARFPWRNNGMAEAYTRVKRHCN